MSKQLATIEAAPLAAANQQLDALRQIAEQSTPKEEIRWKKGRGGSQQPYTDPAYVIRTLNEAFGWDWDFIADNEELIFNGERPFEVKVRGQLTVRLAGQAVTKTQFGSVQIEFLKDGSAPVSIGDCYKGAASDALKKCASLLGIALDLYDSDSEVHGGNHQSATPSDPRPQTLSDLVTPKQLWMIRQMAREAGLDADKECKAKFKCGLEEINKRAASALIDHLKRYAEGQSAPEPPADPHRSIDAITVNNEPEGEQQQQLPKLKGRAGQITALADTLKWDKSMLIDEIQRRVGIAIMPGKLYATLEAMDATSQQQLIHALKLELEARAQTTNKKAGGK